MVLGGRTPIEVMIGQQTNTPVDLVLGKKLKDATSVVTRLQLVQKHCQTLAKTWYARHEDLTSAELLRQRKRLRKKLRTSLKEL